MKNVFLSVQLSACSILSSQNFLCQQLTSYGSLKPIYKALPRFLKKRNIYIYIYITYTHFFFCCKLISNVVLHLNFRDDFLSSYCFRKCGAGYRAVCLLTFAAPVSGLRRSSDILMVRTNAVSPLFLLLLYTHTHTISSIYRTFMSAHTDSECPVLKVGLKNFGSPLNKMAFHLFSVCCAHIILCFTVGDNEVINYVSSPHM